MKGDLRLLKRAMIEATCETYDEQCRSLPVPSVSRRHKRRLAAMGVPVSSFPIKHRLIAALVAALLLLTGCAVFHEAIRGLWLRFYDGFLQVSGVMDDTDMPKTIEKLYEPTYLPEGFAETERIWVTDVRCEIIYQPTDCSLYLCYSQQVIKGNNFAINTDKATVSTLTTGSFEIMKVEGKVFTSYTWKNSEYLFYIQTPLSMEDEEVLRLIDSLQ